MQTSTARAIIRKISTSSQSVNATFGHQSSPSEGNGKPLTASQARSPSPATQLDTANIQKDQASVIEEDSYQQPYYTAVHNASTTQPQRDTSSAKATSPTTVPTSQPGLDTNMGSDTDATSVNKMAKLSTTSAVPTKGKKAPPKALSSKLTSASQALRQALRQSKGGLKESKKTITRPGPSNVEVPDSQTGVSGGVTIGTTTSGQLPKRSSLKSAAVIQPSTVIQQMRPNAGKRKEASRDEEKSLYEFPHADLSPPHKKQKRTTTSIKIVLPEKPSENTRSKPSKSTNGAASKRTSGVAQVKPGAKTQHEAIVKPATARSSVSNHEHMSDDDYHASQNLKNGAAEGRRVTRSRILQNQYDVGHSKHAVVHEEASIKAAIDNAIVSSKSRNGATKVQQEIVEDFEQNYIQYPEDDAKDHDHMMASGTSQHNPIALSDDQKSSSPLSEGDNEDDEVRFASIPRLLPKTPIQMPSSPPIKRLPLVNGRLGLIDDNAVRKETVIPWSKRGPIVQGTSGRKLKDRMLSESIQASDKKAKKLIHTTIAPLDRPANVDDSVASQLKHLLPSVIAGVTKASLPQNTASRVVFDDDDDIYAEPSPRPQPRREQTHNDLPINKLDKPTQHIERSPSVEYEGPPKRANTKATRCLNTVHPDQDHDAGKEHIPAMMDDLSNRHKHGAVPTVLEQSKTSKFERESTKVTENLVASHRHENKAPVRMAPRTISQNSNTVDINGSPIPAGMKVEEYDTALEAFSQQQATDDVSSQEGYSPEPEKTSFGPVKQALQNVRAELNQHVHGRNQSSRLGGQQTAPAMSKTPGPIRSPIFKGNRNQPEEVPNVAQVGLRPRVHDMSQRIIEGVSHYRAAPTISMAAQADDAKEASGDLEPAAVQSEFVLIGSPPIKRQRFLEKLRRHDELGDNTSEHVTACKADRDWRAGKQVPVDEDPDMTLVESEDEHQEQIEEEFSDESRTDFEDDVPASTSSSQMARQYKDQWRESLKRHQNNLFEALVEISHQLVRHLIDKEAAIEDIVSDYERNGSQLVKAMESDQETDIKTYAEAVDTAKGMLFEDLGRSERKLQRQIISLQLSRTSMKKAIKVRGVTGVNQKFNKLLKMYG